jgi:hypothetical protein
MVMKINPSGLPTPWPIALANAGFSFYSILTADSEVG